MNVEGKGVFCLLLQGALACQSGQESPQVLHTLGGLAWCTGILGGFDNQLFIGSRALGSLHSGVLLHFSKSREMNVNQTFLKIQLLSSNLTCVRQGAPPWHRTRGGAGARGWAKTQLATGPIMISIAPKFFVSR